MSLLPSSATRTGFDCISWLITTIVTVVSAPTIKVRWVKYTHLIHRGLCMPGWHNTQRRKSVQYLQDSFFVFNDCLFYVIFYLLCLFLFSWVVFFFSLPFFFSTDIFLPISLTPFNYACWLQYSHPLLRNSFSHCLHLSASLSLSLPLSLGDCSWDWMIYLTRTLTGGKDAFGSIYICQTPQNRTSEMASM